MACVGSATAWSVLLGEVGQTKKGLVMRVRYVLFLTLAIPTLGFAQELSCTQTYERQGNNWVASSQRTVLVNDMGDRLVLLPRNLIFELHSRDKDARFFINRDTNAMYRVNNTPMNQGSRNVSQIFSAPIEMGQKNEWLRSYQCETK